MKILMCRPDYYDVTYEINPWMDVKNRPDKKLAKEQWQSLYDLYQKMGIEIELIEQGRDLPDMVFTANGGTVYNNTFISGKFRFRERQGEEALFQKWFSDHNYTVKTLQFSQGGEGDALFYKDRLYMGYGFRSDLEVHKEIGDILQVPVVSLHLIDPYFYDFDTTFCPLGDRGVLYYPGGYDKESQERAAQIDGAIQLTKEQAENFVSNSVLVGDKLLVSFCDDDLKKKLSTLDIEPIFLNISEFKKAGGGIKCLTLYLDR